MATPREIITAAYGKSMKNQPGEIATEATELLNVVIRIVRAVFSASARINPTWFGKKATMSEDGAGGSWPRPADAESVWRIEQSDGTEVHIVPFDDRSELVEETTPAVYRFGATYYDAGNDVAAGGDLEAFYSRRPVDPADLDTAIDSAFPDAYQELLNLEVALYLAIKDGREEEYAGLVQERNRWIRLWASFLQHETAGEIRRFESPRMQHSDELVALVAGTLGTNVEV